MPALCYKRVLKKLRQVLKEQGNDIWFEDEFHFQQHGTGFRMWVPPEENDPIVQHAPTRKSIALFGGVSANTAEMVSMNATIFNAETFLIFLNKIVIAIREVRK